MTKQGLTIEQKIEEWKKKHGDIFLYEVDNKKCYLRKPDRKTLSAASVIGKSDPMRYNEIMLANCWLEGDEEIKTEDKYFLGISGRLAELVEITEGELKKL